MNWKALHNNKCPKCDAYLQDRGVLIICKKCDFKIKPERLKEILESKPKTYRTMTEEESMERLNNLGMAELEEDFSDSPHLDY